MDNKSNRLEDLYGRTINYIRISVTDRCNLRCVYCMPADGIVPMSHSDILSFEEIVRICRAAADLGLKHVKLTGGEPLVRTGITKLVKQIRTIGKIETLTLTTNGILLPKYMKELAGAGIDGINISLDTLDSEAYSELTRGGCISDVLKGIEAALAYPDIKVKLNCVLGEGWSKQILPVVELGRQSLLHIRFIERMPLIQGAEPGAIEDQVIQLLEKEYGPMQPYENQLGSGPGHYYELEGFRGKIGFISAMSHKFCASCNRVRLTAAGQLRLCLQSDAAVDLKRILRQGGSDQELCDEILEGIRQKPKEHQFDKQNIQAGGMSTIGG